MNSRDLIGTARGPTEPSPRRPSQANLRRAVSTAYYAPDGKYEKRGHWQHGLSRNEMEDLRWQAKERLWSIQPN